MAGDVRGHWRSEEERCIDNLADVAKATERNLFDEILRHFFRHPLAHPDVDEPRRDRVDGDVLARKLARGNLGERDNRRLARGIIRLTEKPHLSAH